MQEDKEAIFDAVDTLSSACDRHADADTMKALPANMRRAAAKGFINATDCADYLTKKGCPFRDCLQDCRQHGRRLHPQTKRWKTLTLDEFKEYSALFEADIYDAIDLTHCCEGRTSYGGPSEASVLHQIAAGNGQLDAWEVFENA